MKFNSVKFKRLYNGQTEPLKERIFFLCQWPFKVPQVMGILFVLSRELIFNARLVNSLWILCQQGWKISQTALEKQCSDHVTGTEWNLSSWKYHRCKPYGIISTKFKMSCKLVFYIHHKCFCFVCHRTFLKVRKRPFDCSCLICIVFLFREYAAETLFKKASVLVSSDHVCVSVICLHSNQLMEFR